MATKMQQFTLLCFMVYCQGIPQKTPLLLPVQSLHMTISMMIIILGRRQGIVVIKISNWLIGFAGYLKEKEPFIFIQICQHVNRSVLHMDIILLHLKWVSEMLKGMYIQLSRCC